MNTNVLSAGRCWLKSCLCLEPGWAVGAEIPRIGRDLGEKNVKPPFFLRRLLRVEKGCGIYNLEWLKGNTHFFVRGDSRQ